MQSHLERYRVITLDEDDTERLQLSEIVRSGSLRDYLAHDFLAGYMASGPEDYAAIPDLVQDMLQHSVFSVPSISHVEVSGSVAKCMAHGVPERFWEYSRVFQGELETLRIANLPDDSDEARLVGSLSADAAADIDIKIFGQALSIPSIFDQVTRHYGVPENHVAMTQASGVPGNGYHFVRTATFDYPHNSMWSIQLYEGPVPTNPARRMMTVSFIHKDSDKRAFHIDIGELPTTGTAVETDKRQGKTSLKQDICVAELSIDNRVAAKPTLRYTLRQDAVEAMQGQDEIMTESNRPGDVLEIALRSLRMNVLHTVQRIPVENGELELPQLGMFLPHYENGTLFALRKRIRELHETVSPTSDSLLIPRRELALCLTIDPYITIQALRDSGIATLIPGLSHVSHEQWDAVLASRHLVVEPLRTTNAEERDIDLITGQRDIYIKGKNHTLLPSSDGLHRFISALRDLGIVTRSNESSVWSSYVDLWRTGSTSEHEQLQLNRAKSIIYRQTEGTLLQQEYYPAIQPRSQGEIYNHTAEMADSRWTGAAAIYLFLQRYPAGLTALELEGMYEDFPLVNKTYEFRQLFLDLKTLGLVKRYTMDRVTRRGRVVPVDVYTVLPRVQRQSLQHLASDTAFQDLIGGANAEMTEESTDLVVFLLHTLPQLSGANTIEALESFTMEDYELIDQKVKAGPAVLMRVCTTLIKIYERYRQMKDF